MKKPTNFGVDINQCKGNVERMIRRFIKKTKKERIVEQVRENSYYTKPSVAKREKRLRAQRRRRREELKKQRMAEKRARNNN